MSKTTTILLSARLTAPCAGPAFDAWMLPLVIATLEPMQADILRRIISAGGTLTTEQLCGLLDATPQQVGSAVSDLRKLSLLKSTPIPGGATRATRHVIAAWVLEASL